MKIGSWKFKSQNLFITISLLLPILTAEAVEVPDYTLEQVVIFSRHGLRAPLATPSSTLGQLTSHQWPLLDTKASYLTTKGGVLESYFGHYIQEWLVDNQLLDDKKCPTEKDIFFYANSMQRTIATAQYLALGAYPGCNVFVYHKEKMNTMDALFSLNIRDDSEQFKQQAIASINQNAGENGINGLNQRLQSIYQKMEQIIDYQGSVSCEGIEQCHLTNLDTNIRLVAGEEPGITGPLRIGTSLADAFILQYYEGIPLKKIAWGNIDSVDELKQLVSIKEYYNSIVFGSPVIANYVTKNLLSYIYDSFAESSVRPKVTVLVGHDSNIASLLSALQVKPYHLPNQFETTPIGGKLFFERWKDNQTGKQLMKIEYIYQSTEQIINMAILNRHNPPQVVTLQLTDCPTDQQGFCDYETFKTQLERLIQ